MGRQAGAPFFCFYKERLGTGSPPHPPQCTHWGTFPPRGRLWGGGSAAWRSWDYYGSHVYPLIWNLSFTKMLSSIFFSKMRPKSVLVYRRKLPLCRIRNNHRKNQRVGTSGHKNPGPGRSPGVLSSGFLPKKARTQRVAGEGPRPPWVRGRSLALARFGDCCPGSVRGAVSSEILRPIWDAFPGKIC